MTIKLVSDRFEKTTEELRKCTQQTAFPLHFVIVGGGIAGLATAIALRRVGHRVTVLERDAELLPKPHSGCRIVPNLAKILYDWGLEKQLRSIAVKPEAINFRLFETGEYLGKFWWDNDALKETRGDFAFVHHAELRRILYQAAVAQGAYVRFGAEVVEVDPTAPTASLKCGETVRADIIVGADGVGGKTRQTMLEMGSEECGGGGGGDANRLSLKMFSTIVPKQAVLKNSELAYLYSQDMAAMSIWMGNEHCVLGYPIGKNADFALCAYGPYDGDAGLEGFEYILRTAEKSLRKLGELAPPPTCIPVAQQRVLDEWVKGRLVVLGGAAHPLPPGSAQSWGLSVADGAAFAKLFSHIHSEDQVSILLKAFQSIRKTICESMCTKEAGIVHYMTMPPGEQQEYRDQSIRARRDAGLEIVGEEQLADNSPEWVEVKDVFGYEAEDEADNWWVSWGIFSERPKCCVAGCKTVVDIRKSVKASITIYNAKRNTF